MNNIKGFCRRLQEELGMNVKVSYQIDKKYFYIHVIKFIHGEENKIEWIRINKERIQEEQFYKYILNYFKLFLEIK